MLPLPSLPLYDTNGVDLNIAHAKESCNLDCIFKSLDQLAVFNTISPKLVVVAIGILEFLIIPLAVG